MLFAQAIREHVGRSKFFPTPADIKAIYQRLAEQVVVTKSLPSHTRRDDQDEIGALVIQFRRAKAGMDTQYGQTGHRGDQWAAFG